MYTVEITAALREGIAEKPPRLIRKLFLLLDVLKLHGEKLDRLILCDEIADGISVYSVSIHSYPGQKIRLFIDTNTSEVHIVGLGAHRPTCERAIEESLQYLGIQDE